MQNKTTIIGSALLILTIGILYAHINNQATKQNNIDIQNYKQCIQQQSDTRGWIIRSECSTNYNYYDQVANIKYKQIGYDLYLDN